MGEGNAESRTSPEKDSITHVPSDERERSQLIVNKSANDFIAVGGSVYLTDRYTVATSRKLRGRLTRAITVAEALQELKRKSYVENYSRVGKMFSRITNPIRNTVGASAFRKSSRSVRSLQAYMEELRDLEPAELMEDDEEGETAVSPEMAALYDKINVAIAGLQSDFIGRVRAAETASGEAHHMAGQIARQDLKKMAQTHAYATD